MSNLEPEYEEPNGVPIFRPSYEEFQDFYSFLLKIEPHGQKVGLVKIIPPKEWLEMQNTSFKACESFKIKKPISQQFNVGGLPSGAQRQFNIEHNRSYTVNDWFKLSQNPQYQPPKVSERGKLVLPEIQKRKRKEDKLDQEHNSNNEFKEGELQPSKESNEDPIVAKKLCVGNEHDLISLSKVEDVDMLVNNNNNETAIQEITDVFPVETTESNISIDQKESLVNIEDEVDIEPPNYINVEDYQNSKEFLDDLERFYWRNLSFQNTLYGADLKGSLFKKNPENKWNVSNLENLLTKIKAKVPGVTTPYLYFGMYKATFAWHVEDMDLASINYIHFGAPKIWYVINPTNRTKFERFAKSLFYTEAGQCTEFLRHKNCVISPKLLAANHIPVSRLIHRANEFVITFPSAYHQGFNTGFNCAESINIATPSWLDVGKFARFCECESDSVQLDMKSLFGIDPVVQPHRGRIGNGRAKNLPKRLPLPMYIEPIPPKKSQKPALPPLPNPKCCLCPLGHEEDFPLMPTDDPLLLAHVECGAFIPETFIKKLDDDISSSDTDLSLQQDVIMETENNNDQNAKVYTESDISQMDTKKDSSEKSNKSENTDHELNVESSTQSVETVTESKESKTKEIEQVKYKIIQNPLEELYTDVELNGKQLDALETHIKIIPSLANAPYQICGISSVPKDRYRLKCAWCQYPANIKNLGACVQCTKGKCVRAFHVTCALLGAIHLVLDEEGTMECFCLAHDPVIKQEKKSKSIQNIESESLEKFKVSTLVIARFQGCTYQGIVTEIQPEQKGCMVHFEGQDEPTFAPWLSLTVYNPPKPKVKPKPVYCTPPRKTKMKAIMQELLGNVDFAKERLFTEELVESTPIDISTTPVDTIPPQNILNI